MDQGTQLAFLILACFLGAGMIASFRKGLLSPYFLFFSYLFVGVIVRGYYLSDDSAFDSTDFWSIAAPLVQRDFLAAYLELLTAIMIAVAASRVIIRIRNPLEDAFLRFFSFRPAEIHFAGTMVAAGFFCLSFVGALAVSGGGLAEAFLSLQKRARVFGSEMFVIRILSVVFSVAVALLVYKISAEHRSSSRLRKSGVLCFVLLDLALLLLSGGRGEVMKQVLVLLYLRNRGIDQGNIGIKSTFLIGALGSVVVVGGIAIRRSAQFGMELSDATVDAFKTAGHSLSGAFPITDLYLATRYYANSTGHDYGFQFLLYFVRYIPRSLWEGKPENLGYAMREFYYGDTLAGVIPTMFGEFYIAWGLVGIVFCGLFLGWVLSFLLRAYHHATSDSKFALIYVMLAVMLVFDGLRAGLEIAVFLMFNTLATLTCFKLAARMSMLSVK